MCRIQKHFDLESYQDRIDSESKKRVSDKKSINKLIAETDLSLRKFNGHEKRSICFKDLQQFELNKWYDLNEKVRIKKIKDIDDVLVFETEIKEGGEFGWHFHDDCSEICTVIKGSLYDAQTSKTYEKGESVIYSPGCAHIPKSLVDTFLIVTFKLV